MLFHPLIGSVFLALFFIGCSSVSSINEVGRLDPEVYYRHDLRLEINGKKINGVGVAPASPNGRYEIEVKSPGKMDLLRVSTCAGEVAMERKGYSHDFKLNLSDDFEGRGSCILRFEAYEHKAGRHSWGLVDFKTAEETLPATIYCNGIKRKGEGVEVCESKEKLWQKIVFPVEVQLPSIKPNCSLGKNKGKDFEFRMPNRECIYRFQEIAKPNRVFRLTLIGYENILVRGEVKSNWDRENDQWDWWNE